MIDEDVLRRLLSETAETAAPPVEAPEALLEALAADAHAVRPPRRLPRRQVVATLGAAAAALLIVVAAFSLGDTTQGRFTTTGDQTVTDAAGGLASGGETAATTIATTIDGATAAGGSGTGGAIPTPPPAQPLPPGNAAKIVKTGSLDLELKRGAFEGTVAKITSLAVVAGGYIAESTTSESGEAPSGSITVRVPVTTFEQVLADARELGEVRGVTAKGADVTAQFTDLSARLTALTATRTQLLTVLSGANAIPDILAVQDRLNVVQIEIEQLEGQRRVLEDQAAISTLSITLAEPGAEVRIESDDRGLGAAWHEARQRFGDGLEDLVAWSGSAFLVLLVLILLAVVGRVGWLLVRRQLV